MSIIKSYYVTRAGANAAYSTDLLPFVDIPGYSSVFSGATGSIGVDPSNGNKVIFTGRVGSSDVIRVSTDNGTTLNTPTGDWGSFPINVNSASISYIDSQTIIIVGLDGMFKSLDGGDSFYFVADCPSFAVLYGDAVAYSSAYFAAENVGMLALSKGNGVLNTKIYKTLDGGANWTYMSNYAPADETKPITDMWLSPDYTKFIAVNSQQVIRSTNGGSVFTYPLTFTFPNTAGTGAKLSIVSSSIMYAGGGAGAVYKSINGGISWTQQRIGLPSDIIIGMYFYDATNGYVCINDVVYKTSDSGVTLTQISTTPSTVVDIKGVNYECGTCPDTYTKVAHDTCEGTSVSPDQCPEGSTYDPVENICVLSDNCPETDVMFILDMGGSVIGTERTDMVDFLSNVVAATNITDGLNNGLIKMGFCVFAGSAPTGPTYTLDLTSDIAAINNYITTVLPGVTTGTLSGGTNTAAGFETATNMIYDPLTATPGANKKMILVTDGAPVSLTPSGVAPLAPSYSFTLDNQAGTSQTFTVTLDTTPPCGRQANPAGSADNLLTDCDKCAIFENAMEMSDYLKSTFDVHITVAILVGRYQNNSGVELTDIRTITPSFSNPGNAPTIEAYITYRANILGQVDMQTHIFPPSQDPTSPYYVASGYMPPNPIVGGHLGLSGMTGVTEGVSFGRLIYGLQSSVLNVGPYSSSPSQWPQLPSIYSTITTNQAVGSGFQPYAMNQCLPSTYAPMCSYNDSGEPDAYVSYFDNADEVLAPQIAAGICITSLPVDCGEGCTPVPYETNVRCECEKTLVIQPCIYNIYSCDDLDTPLYCTTNDLSLDVGNVVNLSIDGSPITGCYKVAFSDKDYCDTYTNIAVTATFLSCTDCNPTIYQLTTCADNSNISIYTKQEDIADYLGKVVVLLDYPKLCWTVSLPTQTVTDELQTVTVSQDYPDCPCCFEYQH
jgi:photosystem II stability/assembly factor-like uncharacterized protein